MPEQVIDLSFGGKGENTATLVNLTSDGEEEKATIENYEFHSGNMPDYHQLVNGPASQYPYNYSIPPAYYPMSYYMPPFYGYGQNFQTMMPKAPQSIAQHDDDKHESHQPTQQMFLVDTQPKAENTSSDSERSSQEESDLIHFTTNTKSHESPFVKDSIKGRGKRSRDTLNESQKRRKNRTSYTPRQIDALERAFQESPYPDGAMLETMSLELDLPESTLKIWFQNKRARWRKNKKELPNGATPRTPTVSNKVLDGDTPISQPILHGSTAPLAHHPYIQQAYQAGIPSSAADMTTGYNPMQYPSMEPQVPIPSRNSSPTSTSPATRTPSPDTIDSIHPDDSQKNRPLEEAGPQYPPFTHLYDMYQRYVC